MKKKYTLEQLRHSAAHLAAHAVLELFPDTILTIGPPTATGFFYDFLPERNFKEEDLPKIEARMHEISKRDLPLTHTQVPKEEARALFKGNRFKLELIDGIPGDTVGIAQQGDFKDLCKGGHVASTGDIKHFKLFSISGSYWRADRDGQALQRVTGTAFFSKEELDEYLDLQEQAAKYDHRKLGRQLELFSFHEEGVGFPFFHPKGKKILNLLTTYLRNLLDQEGYQEITTPIMLSDELWKRSGHYDHYKENMYFCEIDERMYAIKPMNCPGAILLYSERPHSFRELPLRLSEFGLVHRHELSGVMHGLFRVRSFTIDDGHIFCTPDQLGDELVHVVNLTKTVLTKFGFTKIKVGLSTKPAKAMGSDALWQKATQALEGALKKADIDFVVQEGEGAFYGPKIDFNIEDSMKREWQCGTAQVDFFQAENFDLSYVASGGGKERPVVIHRAIFGSFERFFAILLEHFKGHLPFWLSPVQVKVLTITDDQRPYAQTVLEHLKQHGLRAEISASSEPLSGKIKAAQLEKVPWMLVLGKKEEANNTVTLRQHDGKQQFGLSLDDLIQEAEKLS